MPCQTNDANYEYDLNTPGIDWGPQGPALKAKLYGLHVADNCGRGAASRQSIDQKKQGMDTATAEFVKRMNARRAHFLTHSGLPFPASSRSYFRAVGQDLPPGVIQATKDVEADLDKLTERTKREVDRDINEFKQDRNTEEFRERMEERRKKMRDSVDRTVDEFIDRMIKEGTEHPELQDRIEKEADVVTFFVDGYLGEFLEELRKIVGIAIQFVQDALRELQKFAETAVSTVKSFFGSLF